MQDYRPFFTHRRATASPSPQTGETTTTGSPRTPPLPVPDEGKGMVMYPAETYQMDIGGTYSSLLPLPIDDSPSWQGDGGNTSGANSMWRVGGGTAIPSTQGGNQRKRISSYSTPTITITDISSFKAVVQRFTGMCPSSTLPRSSVISDVQSDKTTQSEITHESNLLWPSSTLPRSSVISDVQSDKTTQYEITHESNLLWPSSILPRSSVISDVQSDKTTQSEITHESNLLYMREIIGRVSNMKDEIVGRVEGKHEEIKGRSVEKHKIMEFILSHDPDDNRLTIFCITGADGLGKTTLASLVYCDDTTCRSFEARAWLCLPMVYGYEDLLRSVLESLTGVSCGLIEQDELEEVMKEELTGKKFLLVLDNLSENNAALCRRLFPLLSLGDKGSAMLITTSSDMLAVHLGTAYVYKLKPFMHDSFMILAKPNLDTVDYPSLESIIRKFPSQYSGFPMLAKVICGILYSAFSELDGTVGDKLTAVLNKPDNHLHHMLYLSYGYLRPNQKRCILYCSLFPRNYTFNEKKLLRLWMSQGFIVPEKEMHEHDHRDNCEDAFSELLHRSFFDYFPSSDVKKQKYAMHELSSHLAASASGDKFFRAHDHELHCIPKDVRHLSVILKQCDSEIYLSPFIEFGELSSFLLVCNPQLESTDNQFHVMDPKSLDEIFRNFRYLKTLDLSHTDIKELPESIGYMSTLCFLGLNNTNIRRLPNSVCDLFKLQTMELQNSAYLVELPNDIKNLSNLYHLDASKEHGAIYVPPGIGQLVNLETLTTFTVGGLSWNCKISELAYLNNLKGYLHICSLNNVENAEDAWTACLAAKKLKKLSLEWCHNGDDVESNGTISIAEKVLNALKPHYLLGELNIKGYYGLEFPSWIADYAMSDLVSITLDNCYNCEKLPDLGVLPLLRCLFIQNLRGVKVISCEICATGTVSTRKNFPKLEILKLREMYNLEYWYDVMDGDFASLRSLSIERCPKLNSIPCFQSLSDLSILSCGKLNLPCLPSLQTLKFGSLKQRNCLALPSELLSLQMLEVTCCDHLCSVDGLIRMQSLKQLKFQTCPELNFFQDEPLPDTLETVDIHDNCYALRNWRPHGFEELSNASKVRRKFIRRKFIRKLFYMNRTIK